MNTVSMVDKMTPTCDSILHRSNSWTIYAVPRNANRLDGWRDDADPSYDGEGDDVINRRIESQWHERFLSQCKKMPTYEESSSDDASVRRWCLHKRESVDVTALDASQSKRISLLDDKDVIWGWYNMYFLLIMIYQTADHNTQMIVALAWFSPFQTHNVQTYFLTQASHTVLYQFSPFG